MCGFEGTVELQVEARTCTTCVIDSPAQRRMTTTHAVCICEWPASTCNLAVNAGRSLGLHSSRCAEDVAMFSSSGVCMSDVIDLRLHYTHQWHVRVGGGICNGFKLS